MKKPSKPQSQIEEVLYYLITRICIDRRQMMQACSVLNLPAQISFLRNKYNVSIKSEKVSVLNKFGRVVEYTEYKLIDKLIASEQYKTLQTNNIHYANLSENLRSKK